MSKSKLILICLGAVFVLAIYVAYPRETTVMARAEKPASTYDSYVVTVKRWRDHDRGGRYKQYGDLFGIELSHRGGIPVTAYELEPSELVTNVVITWPELGSFVVTFNNSLSVKCVWSSGKAVWERK